MKIEVWSDYVCPFCYIGKRNLEEALKAFPEAEVTFKAFELDPNTPKNETRTVYEMLSDKYGMSLAQARQTTVGVTAQAKQVGLNYEFEGVIHANTFDAHRLAKWAEQQGKGNEWSERVLAGYFTEKKAIGQHDTLLDLVEEIGLNRVEAAAVLADETQFAVEVRTDEAMAQQIGVRGVPFFVIDEKYALSGAQPVSAFTNALAQVVAERKPLTMMAEGEACGDDGCAL